MGKCHFYLFILLIMKEKINLNFENQLQRLENKFGIEIRNSVRCLSLKKIAEKIDLSVEHVQRSVVCQPSFPRPIRTHENGHPRWIESEVDEWLLSQR